MEELIERIKTVITEEVARSKSETISVQAEVQVTAKVLTRITRDELIYQQIRELVDWELWERRNRVDV